MAADADIFWEPDEVLEPTNILDKEVLNNEPIVGSYIAVPASGRECRIIIKGEIDRAVEDADNGRLEQSVQTARVAADSNIKYKFKEAGRPLDNFKIKNITPRDITNEYNKYHLCWK